MHSGNDVYCYIFRSCNFTSHEEDLLVSLVEKYSSVVESKKTNAVTWSQKRDMWDKIASEFQKQCETYRTVSNLKAKYENLKKKTKQTMASARKEIYLTGGGTNTIQVTNMDERVAAIMGTSACGLTNEVDSDKGVIYMHRNYCNQ